MENVSDKEVTKKKCCKMEIDNQSEPRILDSKLPNQEVCVGIRPEGFEVNENGSLTVKGSFANAGLSTHQVSNDDLRMILDNFLNGGQTTTFGTVMA